VTAGDNAVGKSDGGEWSRLIFRHLCLNQFWFRWNRAGFFKALGLTFGFRFASTGTELKFSAVISRLRRAESGAAQILGLQMVGAFVVQTLGPHQFSSLRSAVPLVAAKGGLAARCHNRKFQNQFMRVIDLPLGNLADTMLPVTRFVPVVIIPVPRK